MIILLILRNLIRSWEISSDFRGYQRLSNISGYYNGSRRISGDFEELLWILRIVEGFSENSNVWKNLSYIKKFKWHLQIFPNVSKDIKRFQRIFLMFAAQSWLCRIMSGLKNPFPFICSLFTFGIHSFNALV